MFDANIFDTKVINDETELDRTPFMMPEARGRERLIETFFDEARAKKIVGKDASLRETIAALANFEIHPAVTITSLEGLFLNELLRNVRHFDADIFWVRHGSVKVEVLEIDGAKEGALS